LALFQPPECDKNRRRRQASDGAVEKTDGSADAKDADEGAPATIEVYSGLYVNEVNDQNRADLLDDVRQKVTPQALALSLPL